MSDMFLQQTFKTCNSQENTVKDIHTDQKASFHSGLCKIHYIENIRIMKDAMITLTRHTHITTLTHTNYKHYNSSLVLFCSSSVCLSFFNHLLNTAIGSMFQCLWKEMGVWWAKNSFA